MPVSGPPTYVPCACVALSLSLTSGTVEGVASGDVVARAGQGGRHRDAHDAAVVLAQVLGPVLGIVLGAAVPDAPVQVVVRFLQKKSDVGIGILRWSGGSEVSCVAGLGYEVMARI